MKDFKSPRKPGGFGGSSRGGFGGSSRGGFGDRGGFGGRGGRDSERPTMHKAICSDCGNDCEVPFRPNGTKPVLCSSCFSVQKGGNERPAFGGRDRGGRDFDRGGRDFDRAEKEMFHAVCQECGNDCEVPFRPTAGKPIFCSECFHGADQGRKPQKSHDGHQDELTAIHAKLDQIMNLLKGGNAREEKAEKKPVIANVEKVVKEVAAVIAPKKEKAVKVVKKEAKVKEVKVKKAPAKKKKA